MTDETPVTILAPGESRQHDAKGEPKRAPVLRRKWNGRGFVAIRSRPVRCGKLAPEPELYTRQD